MASWTGIIYLTINLINNKIYIGQTITQDPNYIGSGSRFLKEVRKYGKRAFKREVLKTNIFCMKELSFWEEFYIKLYNSTDLEIGYNTKIKGYNRGFKHKPESIEKIKKRANQEDNKIRIREIQKISSIKRIGSHHSKESKIKMMNSKFGKHREIEIYNKKDKMPIHICNFSKEASRFTNSTESAVRNVLCGIAKSSNGYFFKYKNNS